MHGHISYSVKKHPLFISQLTVFFPLDLNWLLRLRLNFSKSLILKRRYVQIENQLKKNNWKIAKITLCATQSIYVMPIDPHIFLTHILHHCASWFLHKHIRFLFSLKRTQTYFQINIKVFNYRLTKNSSMYSLHNI